MTTNLDTRKGKDGTKRENSQKKIIKTNNLENIEEPKQIQKID